MGYTPSEFKNISNLLLSVDDANVELAFVLIKGIEVSKDLISELFAIYKLGTRQHAERAKEALMIFVDDSDGLLYLIKNRSDLDGSSPRKTIKKMASKCADIDPMKLAMALYNRYGEGLQYLVSELPEKDLKELLSSFLKNGKFELTDKKITKVPTPLFTDYTNIKELVLSNNEIKTLPAGIGKLLALEKLDLSKNKLNKINKAIGKLKNLKELNLAGNYDIEEFPKEIGELKSLEVLNINGISLENIAEVLGQYPNLEKLNWSVFNITKKPIDKSFFDLKFDKLIELQLDDNGGQKSWTNLPRITKVVGTYEDPISLHPLALAKRAYAQNGEGLEYLLEHSESEDVHPLLTSSIEGETLKLEKLHLNRLPKELADYNIKKLELVDSDICNKKWWTDLVYLPQLEVVDFGLLSKVDYWNPDASFLFSNLKALSNLKELNLGLTQCKNVLDHIHELPNLEKFWFLNHMSISSSDDFSQLDGFSVLKNLPQLKEFCIRGISNNYYRKSEKAKKIKEEVANYLRQWLPVGCKITVGHIGPKGISDM